MLEFLLFEQSLKPHTPEKFPQLVVKKFEIVLFENKTSTVKIRTPKTFAVITLKFEQDGFTIEKCIQTMQADLQTV